MLNFGMEVNRYCMECLKNGEFLQLKFVMINLTSGMWMCSKDECVFPMNSNLLKEYMEEDLTSKKVLLLTNQNIPIKRRKKRRRKELLTKDRLQGVTQNDSSTPGQTTSESSESSLPSLPSTQPVAKAQYPLWENDALLCWLDCTMSLLVLNTTFQHYFKHNKSACFLSYIFEEYKKARIMYAARPSYKHVQNILVSIRQNVFGYLQPKLLVNYSETDSPLFCLPLLLKTNVKFYASLEVEYSCRFNCTQCQFEKIDGFRKIILSIPNCSEEFNPSKNLEYTKSCYRCNSPDQVTKCNIETFPSVLFVHFPDGVANSKYWIDWQFTSPDGETYIITQIVQYIAKKQHFILWCFNNIENLWLSADDLAHPVGEYKHGEPQCPSSQVHILVWEKLSSLRETDKTTKVQQGSEEGNALIEEEPVKRAKMSRRLNDSQNSNVYNFPSYFARQKDTTEDSLPVIFENNNHILSPKKQCEKITSNGTLPKELAFEVEKVMNELNMKEKVMNNVNIDIKGKKSDNTSTSEETCENNFIDFSVYCSNPPKENYLDESLNDLFPSDLLDNDSQDSQSSQLSLANVTGEEQSIQIDDNNKPTDQQLSEFSYLNEL